jgi:hypothetical protein
VFTFYLVGSLRLLAAGVVFCICRIVARLAHAIVKLHVK